ncbi:AAA family ATPase [Streptomyces sp. NBC_01136]|uniref:helix-turn-helix transcriptional regulator n=1 Tax=Streptomyces sp. NBC_01136 TaxID=2903754 RepID=UPI00386756D0|nr:AAA family ATPase [Streptomyces sp. NBC_01136]WST81109.1 AAA family ATPase [Streptomyces sp. NBC_01136]
MVLLHRDDECARLDKALRACTDGTAQLVLVEGAPGCGKTRLVQYAADAAAERGLTVLHAAADPAARRQDHALLRRLADGLTAGPSRPAPAPDTTGTPFASLLRAACARGPVALCIDDLQYADRASLAELLRLTHALRHAPLLTVLAQSPYHRSDGSGLHTELLRHHSFVRIPLARLDARSTAELARFWGTPVPAGATAQLHRLSGGNPLLLRALLAETGPADGRRPGWPQPGLGGPFAEAFAICVQRCGSAARRLALALAVLGEQADLRSAAPLARLSPDAAARAHHALDAAGLAAGARLLHPTAESAVLATLPPAQRRSLHRDAARVLHHALAEPAVVARRLLAAQAAAHDWEIQALRDAARQEPFSRSDPDQAQACLRLARSGCRDVPTRLRITLQLAAHTWRLHPAAAHRLLDEPQAALRAGKLPPADAGWLARLLAAQGRVEEADEALGRAAQGARPAAAHPPLRDQHPAPQVPVSQVPVSRVPASRVPAPPSVRAAALWLPPHAPDGVAAAERLLAGTPLTQAAFELIDRALRTLVEHRPHSAIAWCRRLGEQAPAREAPGWQAAFATAHAQSLLHLGDLAGARREATSALGHLAGRGGPYLLAPLALLVQALTEQGEYAKAALYLHPTLPGEPYSTVHALAFLGARGRYYLATARPREALEEFLEAGSIAGRWGVDQPALLPWRTGAAQALLHLGRPAQAQALLADQLARAAVGGARVRGVALRLSAATAEPRRRVELLSGAVDELRDYGDRLELARSLADLGSALRLSGEGTRAGTITRRAWQLAGECGALPLCEQIRPAPGPQRAARPAAGRDAGRLSGAEERVATLAAQGHTNREIAAKLYVSASTVERHLTCAYRKLGISRRQDLPLDLRTRTPEQAGH